MHINCMAKDYLLRNNILVAMVFVLRYRVSPKKLGSSVYANISS